MIIVIGFIILIYKTEFFLVNKIYLFFLKRKINHHLLFVSQLLEFTKSEKFHV